MGIFDFFKRKKDNTEDIDLEKAVDIKEINESDNSTVNNDTDFKYNFTKSDIYYLENIISELVEDYYKFDTSKVDILVCV